MEAITQKCDKEMLKKEEEKEKEWTFYLDEAQKLSYISSSA